MLGLQYLIYTTLYLMGSLRYKLICNRVPLNFRQHPKRRSGLNSWENVLVNSTTSLATLVFHRQMRVIWDNILPRGEHNKSSDERRKTHICSRKKQIPEIQPVFLAFPHTKQKNNVNIEHLLNSPFTELPFSGPK